MIKNERLLLLEAVTVAISHTVDRRVRDSWIPLREKLLESLSESAEPQLKPLDNSPLNLHTESNSGNPLLNLS